MTSSAGSTADANSNESTPSCYTRPVGGGRIERVFAGKLNMRMILGMLLLPGAVCGEELAPWNASRHPTDVSRWHVQDIAAGRQEYSVVQDGTMDGRNCRSPQGVWTPFEQTWESNR